MTLRPAVLRIALSYYVTSGLSSAVGLFLIASVTLMPAALAIVGRRGFWPTSGRVAYVPGTNPDLPAPAQYANWSE